MSLLITGAQGYIGSQLVKLASARGHAATLATRRPPTGNTHPRMAYDLGSVAPLELPPGTSAVIHLAAVTSGNRDLEPDQEVCAAQNLLAAAARASARFVFVSSQTARADAPSVYGRTKWRIEREVLGAGGWVARPGMVYGGPERGLFGTLVGLVRRLPVLPAFIAAPKVQPVHVDDVADGLIRMAVDDQIPAGVYCLASPEPVSFTVFLSAIARFRLRRRRLFLPVPSVLITAAARVVGSALSARLGLERLRSLFDLPVMSTRADLERLSLALRPLELGLCRSGSLQRRRLLEEGHTLLSYLLKEAPGVGVVRRYVRAIESLRDGRDIGLPALFRGLPATLAILDRPAKTAVTPYDDLAWRLNTATILAETTIVGARRFMGKRRGSGVFFGLARVGGALCAELSWRLLRFFCHPFLVRERRRSGQRAR